MNKRSNYGDSIKENNMENKTSSVLALAVLGLSIVSAEASSTATKTSTPAATETKGQCFGVNTCKGTSACHSEANMCAGTNSCKGKGWLTMTEKDCKTKKGKFVKG